jgi:kynurenine 3-monooxygenase
LPAFTAKEMEKNTVVGAGLVGSLLSIYLANRGAKVNVYERRPDMRKANISAGKSINLALSDRGLKALRGVGIEQDIIDISIPMYGRMVHDVKGNTNFQPYGKEGQSILSVSRGELNRKLMSLAESHPNVTLHFNQRCTAVDIDAAKATFIDDTSGIETIAHADCIYGTDGAFSAVRARMQFIDRFNYSQQYLEHGYKELTIPPAEDGGFRMDKNCLHIWPRGNYMLIALPNLDGSFTCTLFFPFEGERSFASLTTPVQVEEFFNEVFPDAVPHMPTLVEDYFANPTSSLVIIRCSPWHYKDKVCLMGDAAHAIVPFYGQGMNAGFEDCSVFEELSKELWDDKSILFARYSAQRKPDGDAIADLALRNFIEMRDLVADTDFLLRKKIEKALNDNHPAEWIPLYSMVTFSHMRYSDALAYGKNHDRIMNEVLSWPDISANWQTPDVMARIEQVAGLA